MPTTDELQAELLALKKLVTGVVATSAQLGREVSKLTSDLNALKTSLASIPAPAQSLAAIAANTAALATAAHGPYGGQA